jgi:ribosome-associated protein
LTEHPDAGVEAAARSRRQGAEPESSRPEGAAPDPAGLAERIASIATDRKAAEVRIIDLRGIVSYTDYFVICSGRSDRQARAIQEAIRQELKAAHGLLPRRVEGEREARWILMDYLDCVAHIFTPEARSYYRLEQLWGEAPSHMVGEPR